jgi:uncharacterized membrane protein (DUF373 family)
MTTITNLITTTKTIPTITNACVLPKDLLLLNEPFIYDSINGKTLAAISSTLLASFCLFQITFYHFRIAFKDKKMLGIFYTPTRKVLNFIYIVCLIAFELIWVYGTHFKMITDSNDEINKNTITITSISLWIIINGIANIILFIGFFSKQYYILFHYVSSVFHIPFFIFVFYEKFMLKQETPLLIIPFLLLIITIMLFGFPPNCFSMTTERFEFEQITYTRESRHVHSSLHNVDDLSSNLIKTNISTTDKNA